MPPSFPMDGDIDRTTTLLAKDLLIAFHRKFEMKDPWSKAHY
ncbi:MAG: hypothetical protein P8171_18790 [Candidatus Thiodiazotropha sp.]